MKIISLLVGLIFPILLLAENPPLWLRYSSISPDGKTIVFTYKNDIYKVASTGGTAIALTINQAIDYKPIWSPNSKTIAFASNRYGSFDIFVIPIKGGTPNRLTFHSGNEVPSSFSPEGKSILFSANIQDITTSASFPKSYLSELYIVNATGGQINQILSTPAEQAKYSKDFSKILFQDKKGGENQWRKHHTSAITRDIKIFDVTTNTFTKITSFAGEDREPWFSADEKTVFYLSEQFNSNFNVCSFPIANPENVTQITKFTTHPVRFLSVATDGTLCFFYNGEIYTKKPDQKSQKVNITILSDFNLLNKTHYTKNTGATEMSVSPDGKEIAFVLRGNIFVSATNYSSTKQITDSPEQERSVSFSPDGRSLLYASERKGAWNIYEAKIIDDNEKNFTNSTLIQEKPIIENNVETFQPMYSPNGKEVAFLEDRVILKVINLKTKKQRKILGKKFNYSYTDGDQWFQWSPDSKSFLVQYSPNNFVTSDVALVSADGKSEPKNITLSGYSDSNPKWTIDGNAMIWKSDRNGYRSHGSWGAEQDIYIQFFSKKEFEKFSLSKEDYELLYDETEKEDTKKDEKIDHTETKEVKTITLDTENLEDRRIRLTINSSAISDAVLSPKGDKLYYLAKFEKGYDLWVKNIRKNETKLVEKLSGGAASLTLDKKGENLFVFSSKKILKIKTEGYKKTNLSYKAEFDIDNNKERKIIFEHIWRQMSKKFYKADMHGVDWLAYKKAYATFLPHINNDFDFAELLSEMLGEVNASHTGAYYRTHKQGGDQTAEFGALYNVNYTGNGLQIDEIVEKSPLAYSKNELKKGTVLEKINGQEILATEDYFKLMNRLAGKKTLLSFFNPKTGKHFTETIKPITIGAFNELLYQRWVKQRRKETDKLSGGKIGYVHVRGMNSSSFREVYSEILGRDYHKDAIIVDTRYNGGGWLHDDLATLLSGKVYVDYVPRGQNVGSDPISKWNKPSAVLISEGNYSDAHAFPFVYKELKIGKLVGMPVPGTMTAVWWEWQQNGTIVFGIPQVGSRDMRGNFLENQQLEPDLKVENQEKIIVQGIDQQLDAAVKMLLQETKK